MLDNPFEEVEMVARVPLFLVKRTFDCPLSKTKIDSKFCLSCSYCKRRVRLIETPYFPNVDMSVECTF